MHLSSRHTLPAVTALLLLASGLSSQSLGSTFRGRVKRIGAPVLVGNRVLSVNDGGGADYQDIQSAVDAASDGDVVLVQTGRYAGFTIDGKSIVVIGESGGAFDFLPQQTVTVRNVDASSQVVVRGLYADAAQTAPQLVLDDNPGVVIVEDMRFESPWIDISSGILEDSDVVVLTRCEFDGGYSLTGESHGIETTNSSLYVYDSVVTTDSMLGEVMSEQGRPGAAALRIDSGFAFLSNSSLIGPDAAECGIFTSTLGDGGPGLESIGSDIEVLGSTVVGGSGGGDGFFCDITNDGPPSVLDGASTFTLLGEAPRSYEITAPLREGAGGSYDLEGPMAETTSVCFAEAIVVTAVPMITGPVLIPVPDTTVATGAIPGSGVLQVPFTAPSLSAGARALTTLGQGMFTGTSSYAVSLSVGVLLDSSIATIFDDLDLNLTEDFVDITTGAAQDCNENGIPDADEIAMGWVTDCNLDGVPDSCENAGVEFDSLAASDATGGDGFGNAVALDGTTVVVGAYQDSGAFTSQGAAYVYELDGTGNWLPTESQKLTSSSPGDFHRFGWDVDVDGDFMVIGSPHRTLGDGEAYVYERIAGVWTEIQVLFASDLVGISSDFGVSVAISGDTIAVGAPFDGAGSVYVFVRDMLGVWNEEQKLVPSDPFGFDDFGRSIGLDGDRLVVGAPLQDTLLFEFAGAAYVFDRSGTIWTETTKLELAMKQSTDRFGLDVDVQGTTIAVGTNGTTPLVPAVSAAFMYELVGSTWTLMSPLIPDPVEPLGFFVSLDTDLLAVTGNQTVHLFARQPDDSWAYRSKVQTAVSIGLGAIAIQNGVLMIGAETADGPVANSGSAYVAVPTDCNGNGVPDACDLSMGTSFDTNGNGVPDECDL